MKKNKTVAYMLAATLLVGGTFLGTKALFTDQVDTAGEISISTGDVDLEVETTQDWTLSRNGEEENKGTGEKVDFDNLKFGDVLTKKVTVTNAGTLKAIVDLVQKTHEQLDLPDGITYTVTVKKGDKTIDNLNDMLMIPGDQITVDLELKVAEGGEHSKTAKTINSDAQEAAVIDLQDSVVIKAKQTTAK